MVCLKNEIGRMIRYDMSQRPTYVEVGPLMTTRFGEVRWSSSGAGANNLINADLTALI